MPTKLNPYISFQDDAREALTFYQQALGGELTISTFAEGGVPHDPSEAGKIMHGQLDLPNGEVLMAADTPNAMAFAPVSGISISLSGDDDAELSGWYDALVAGGTVLEPLVEAPWGDKFGMLTDRFGITWLVNIAKVPAGTTA